MLATAALASALSVTAAAAPTVQDKAEKSSDPQDKIICKRFVETGSLVKAQRTCKSKRDWERERDAIRTLGNPSGSCGQAGAASC
jgi:hypothetical protein